MHSRTSRPHPVVPVALAGALLLGACSTGAGGGPADSPDATDIDPSAEVTITVGDLPTTEQAETRQLMLDRVEQFEAEHPNITVEPTETKWDPTTFNAMLQGGTLPDVLGVAFTDVQGLIERGQIADITDFAADRPVISGLNENVLEVARDPAGRLYGVPSGAYTMGLLYNRDIFKEAGLDPDAPPSTWDEVAAAAEAIAQNTDAGGFGLMTKDNTGGWTLSALSYAFGGLMQDEVDGTTRAVFADTGATTEALEWIADVRWNRDAWVDETLLGGDDARNAFAAGTLGMWIGGADIYDDVVGNRGMDPEAVGIAPLPQQEDGLGALGGGTVQMVSPSADANQVAAALEWIEFYWLGQFTDEEQAVQVATARAEDGLPVGAPRLPIIGPEQETSYLEWIGEHVNVPREHFTAYLESTGTLAVVPEPAVDAQAMYAALDPVLQGVLTDERADVETLVQSAQAQFNAQIGAG